MKNKDINGYVIEEDKCCIQVLKRPPLRTDTDKPISEISIIRAYPLTSKTLDVIYQIDDEISNYCSQGDTKPNTILLGEVQYQSIIDLLTHHHEGNLCIPNKYCGLNIIFIPQKNYTQVLNISDTNIAINYAEYLSKKRGNHE